MELAIRPALPADAGSVAAIYNQGIDERASTFETRPRDSDEMLSAIIGDHPMLVAVGGDNEIFGWAGLSSYRARPCYSGVAEFSIYIDRLARGRGIGKQLLTALVDTAETRAYWKLLSRIFVFNAASRAVCRACGFREVGIYENHSRLDGAWLDVVIVERLIRSNIT